jgi:hypothetical protein
MDGISTFRDMYSWMGFQSISPLYFCPDFPTNMSSGRHDIAEEKTITLTISITNTTLLIYRIESKQKYF